VRSPKAFLMDEPLSNLDAKLRVQMRAEVARIQHRLNTTTVYVTHDQTEAMTLGDRVAIMLSGELQQVDSPMELYNNPANLFVAGFIGSPGMNFLPATIEGETAKLPMVSVTLPQEVRERIGRIEPGKKLIAGIRPEDFEDATQVPAETRGRGTTFNTSFDLVEAMGAEFYVHFGVKADGGVGGEHMDALMQDQGGIAEIGDEGEAVVVARLNAESRAKTGQPTEVWLDATKMHFFDADTGRALSSK
jgi:multiple sugar transport system ATP-binding protein